VGKERKKFISVRLRADLLERIDKMAEQEGLTRTAVIEGICWREFRGIKIRAPVAEMKRMMGGERGVFGIMHFEPGYVVEVRITAIPEAESGLIKE
jgi:hypothetical protein